jgi:hypothetical protein
MKKWFVLVACTLTAFVLGLLLSPRQLPMQSLGLALLGKYFTKMHESGISGDISPSDCRLYDVEAETDPEFRNVGGCTAKIGNTTYYFAVQFTETGAIEYYDLETSP